MRVGVLTGGGDCPGLNAVIRAVTKSLINHGQCEVLGIADGFEGLMLDPPGVKPLGWDEVSGILHVGGTILGTSNSANPLRDEATLEHVGRNVRALGLDVVVAIGGDGTMSLAHGLAEQVGLTCVGVPKTIDNDIANCERSFGFDTAVATATEALRRIESTANSHHRVMIVETMGRHAGWLALEAGIAGAADVILLPEIDYDLQAIVDFCRMREQRQRYTIICIGEGAKESGASLTVRERIEQSLTPYAWAASAMCCASACSPISGARCAPRCWAMCNAAATPLPLTACWPPSTATMRRSWCCPAALGAWSRCRAGRSAAWKSHAWPTPSAPCRWTTACSPWRAT